MKRGWQRHHHPFALLSLLAFWGWASFAQASVNGDFVVYVDSVAAALLKGPLDSSSWISRKTGAISIGSADGRWTGAATLSSPPI